VVQDGQVLGMASAGDLTHWPVEDRAGEIRELVDIAGRRGVLSPVPASAVPECSR